MNTEKKNWKLVNFCEFDPYAVKSYCAIHDVDESLNLGDITKVDETNIEPFTMIVGGSPCQDFSVAGKQKGSVWTCKDCGNEYNPLTVHFSERDKCPNCGKENLDKSRSSLLVEWLRIIRANNPNFGIYENVKNIVGKQFKETTFKLFTDELEEYGYNVYWKVLNAKDYGVPQNRERVYLILIKRELDNGLFKYPEGFDNGTRLKDVLEKHVDEKFYLSDEKYKTLIEIARDNSKDNENELRQIGYINNYNGDANRVYDDGIARTLKAEAGGGGAKTGWYKVDSVVCEQRCDEGIRFYKDEICGTLRTIDSCGDKRVIEIDYVCGVDKSINNTKIIDRANCITAREDRGVSNHQSEGTAVLEVYGSRSRMRKLTPKECFRLMGFSDDNFVAAEKQVSNSQLYKQAGNSIVVDVLYYILIELYKAMPYLFEDLRLSSYFSGIGAFEIALNRLYDGINTGNFTKPQSI